MGPEFGFGRSPSRPPLVEVAGTAIDGTAVGNKRLSRHRSVRT
jgi:hypothetical protein